VPDSPDNLKADVVVVGAGVLGLCAAVELTRRGHDVRVVDPGGANASSVAAGMIAPALEAVLDDVTPARAAMFRDAREAWNGFADAFDLTIHAAPTVWAGGEDAAMAEALARLGFGAVEDENGRMALTSDVLVEPGPALAGMRARLAHPVVEARCDGIERLGEGDAVWRIRTGAGDLEARTVVLATGAAEPIPGLPNTVAALIGTITPIRGQIGFVRETMVAAVTRGHGIYVAPSGAGAVVGATMEAGRRDLAPDPASGEALIAAAAGLGQAVGGPVDWRVGIRGATPDGLPMAGSSGAPGLYLALAPRRNGWLLGPLVGRIVADAVEDPSGGAGSPHAAALDPLRFAIPRPRTGR
jgi:glycine oxidase